MVTRQLIVLGTKKTTVFFFSFLQGNSQLPLSNQCAEAGAPARPHALTRTDTYAYLWHLHHIQTSQVLWLCAMTGNELKYISNNIT